MPKLTRITSPSGAAFTVAAEYAPKFQALINDLEASGYAIKPDTSGGYNPRNIAGTNTPSQHSFGRAIDINWHDNARGSQGTIPRDVAQRLAQQHGFTWGGVWDNPDPMHWEVARNAPAPMAERSLTAFAGVPPSAAPSGGPAPEPATASLSPQAVASAPEAAASTPAGEPSVFGSFAPNDLTALAGLFQQSKPKPLAAPPMPMAAAPQVDMSRIASVLASRPMLGTV